MADKTAGLIALWKSVDARLRAINKTAKRILLALRLATFFLVLAVLGSWACAVLAILRPQYADYLYLIAIVLLSIGLVPWAVIVSLPLRFKSVTRLIDKGYPGNAKELSLRVVARKLHDESIETEELLFDTAINEGRKIWRKMRSDEEGPK